MSENTDSNRPEGSAPGTPSRRAVSPAELAAKAMAESKAFATTPASTTPVPAKRAGKRARRRTRVVVLTAILVWLACMSIAAVLEILAFSRNTERQLGPGAMLGVFIRWGVLALPAIGVVLLAARLFRR